MSNQQKPEKRQNVPDDKDQDTRNRSAPSNETKRQDQQRDPRDGSHAPGSNQGASRASKDPNRTGNDEEENDPTAGGSDIKKKSAAKPSHEDVNRDERGRTEQKSGPRAH